MQILQIDFASFGQPTGSCAAQQQFAASPTCNAAGVADWIRGACVGESDCSVFGDTALFGDPCPGARAAHSSIIHQLLNHHHWVDAICRCDAMVAVRCGAVHPGVIEPGVACVAPRPLAGLPKTLAVQATCGYTSCAVPPPPATTAAPPLAPSPPPTQPNLPPVPSLPVGVFDSLNFVPINYSYFLFDTFVVFGVPFLQWTDDQSTQFMCEREERPDNVPEAAACAIAPSQQEGRERPESR